MYFVESLLFLYYDLVNRGGTPEVVYRVYMLSHGIARKKILIFIKQPLGKYKIFSVEGANENDKLKWPKYILKLFYTDNNNIMVKMKNILYAEYVYYDGCTSETIGVTKGYRGVLLLPHTFFMG